MKKRSLMLTAAALLILPTGTASLAADETYFAGSVELGGQISDGEDEGAKAQEYRDLDDAVFGDFLIDYYKENYFLRAKGDNIGLDDQAYELKGGMYQRYKFSFFYDELPHNLSFNNRSVFSGIGGDNLVIDGADPDNPATWTELKYKVETTRYGGDIEFTLAEPYFLKIGVDRQEKDGVKPLGSGSFSGSVELPEPIDYATNNLTINGGYRSELISFKLEGLYSSFSNDSNYLDWQNSFIGITEHNSLAPDNDFGKIGADLTWRKLPMMSTLVLKGSYTNVTSDTSGAEVGGALPNGLNSVTFDGDISTIRLSAAYLSHPTDQLDTRLYYSYYDRDNDSTVIEYRGGGNEHHLFDYKKHNLGLAADYTMSTNTKLSGGYDYLDVERRNRPDADSNSDNTLFVKLKNTAIETLTASVGYTYLNRDADTDFDLVGVTPFDAEYISQFISRYDAASKSKHEMEFALEFYPRADLDFGLSYTYVNNDYDDVVLGRTDDSGHEFYGDATWQVMAGLHVTGFIGYENYDADSNHYNHRAGFQNQQADPTVDDGSPDSYVWRQALETDFWTIGLLTEMGLLRDRLKVSLAVQYQNSDGTSDISAAGRTFEPLDEYEDYDITSFEAKGVYALTEAMDLTLGYLYEKSSYEDLQYLGYEYNPSGTLLSGAYSDHDYETHVGYLRIRYNF